MQIKLVLKSTLMIFLALSTFCFAKPWTQIVPVRQKIKVSDFRMGNAEILIRSQSGKKAYVLHCHPGDYSEPDFDYSGLVQCRLSALGGNETAPDLFVQPGSTRDWLSRGKFEFAELTGNCAQDIDFGSKRIFLLRGMRIQIEIANLRVSIPDNPVGLEAENISYELIVDVSNDVKALSPSDRRVEWPSPSNKMIDCNAKRSWW